MGRTHNKLYKLELQVDFGSKASLEETIWVAKVKIKECSKLDLRETDCKNVHWVEQI
jgi:hypothetical protein